MCVEAWQYGIHILTDLPYKKLRFHTLKVNNISRFHSGHVKFTEKVYRETDTVASPDTFRD